MAGLGIYHYGARFYSQKLGRFLSADSMVPNLFNPQDLNRFSYVRNNPLRYTDPTGHMVANEDGGGCVICIYTPPSPENDPNIPEPEYNDNCEETAQLSCINEGDNSVTQISHTIYGEGGAGSQQTAANILQVTLNRSYNYWTCWESSGCLNHDYINDRSRIPWENITIQQFEDLLLFVLSEPYGNEAAFNAWTEPYPYYSTGTTYWSDVNIAVENLLNSPITNPWESSIVVGTVSPVPEIRLDVDVQYYVSFPAGHTPPTQPYIWVDILPGGRLQYYGKYPMDDE